MGQHRYYSIYVNGEKDHSTGSDSAKYIRENITTNSEFNPMRYIDKTKYNIDDIKTITFINIKTSTGRSHRIIEDIIVFQYNNEKYQNMIKYIPHQIVNDKWLPTIRIYRYTDSYHEDIRNILLRVYKYLK